MTIVAQGTGWWIETFNTTITLQDAAGNDDSALLTLERPGAFLGGCVTAGFGTVTDNNFQNTGVFSLLDQGSANIAFGENITGVVARVMKASGTSGAVAINVLVMVFMRKSQ